MNQGRKIAILGAVVLVLGGLAYWDEWQTERDEAQKKSENRLVAFDPKDVTAIEYFRADAPSSEVASDDSEGDQAEGALADGGTKQISVKVVREPEGGAGASGAEADDDDDDAGSGSSQYTWKVVQPVSAKADQKAIDNFLKALSEYDTTKVVAEGRDRWDDFDLQDPKRRITLTMAAPEGESAVTRTIFVGGDAPVGYSAYTRVEGSDKVMIGSQYIRVASAKTLFDFRDKAVASIPVPEVTEVGYFRRMPTGDVNLRMKKATEDGTWKVTKSNGAAVDIAADGPEIRDFLEDIAALKARAFVENPDRALQTSLARAQWVVSWVDGSGKTTALNVARQGEKIFGSVGDLVVELPSDVGGKLDKELMTFRDRRIFKFDSDTLATLTVNADHFVNVAGSWYTTEEAAKLDDEGKPKDKDAPATESSHVRSLIVDLEFAKTSAFIQLSDPAVKDLADQAPTHRIKLTSTDSSNQPMTFDFHQVKTDKSSYFVRIPDAPHIFKVSDSILQSIEADADDLSDGDDSSEEGENADNPNDQPGDVAGDLGPGASG